ncbi:MAG: GNAT family N-acetyltransferase [Flavobacteriaceae bacterium]
MTFAPEYQVRLLDDFASAEPLWTALSPAGGGANIAFQDRRWLSLWYRSFCADGRLRPVIAVVTAGAPDDARIDPATVAMVLPLVRRTRYFLPVVEFADRGVSDYNLPLLGPRCPADPAMMDMAFLALKRALRPYALLRLRKMPAHVDGRCNPFGLLADTRPESLQAHNLRLSEGEGPFLQRLGKKKRSEIQRIGRALSQMGPTSFSVAAGAEERNAVFDVIRRAQRQRVPQKGDRYFLEDEGYREFYQSLVDDPEFAGMVTISGIWVGGAPVAGLLGLRHGNRYIGLRIGQSDDAEITRLGLGKVLLAETAQWAIDQGLEIFDFSLGGNALKTWFHPSPFALIAMTSYLNGIVPSFRRGRAEMPLTRAI